jgi:hypothetical protein
MNTQRFILIYSQKSIQYKKIRYHIFTEINIIKVTVEKRKIVHKTCETNRIEINIRITKIIDKEYYSMRS